MNSYETDHICSSCLINRANIRMKCCPKKFCDECLKRNSNKKCPNCRKSYDIQIDHATCDECCANCFNDCCKIFYCLKNIKYTGCKCDCISYRNMSNNNYSEEYQSNRLCGPIFVLTLLFVMLYFIIFGIHTYNMPFLIISGVIIMSLILAICVVFSCISCFAIYDHAYVSEKIVEV